ncbi:sensor of ECF-type sigma factor [Aestuariibaculum sediminum]|uniref:Sensor of ECF-type sigma factor n=1 Tax=Aestuariibaculum sediminum TaxID=2770637 RepID=A0A8J6Q9B0_9FLAO|nr:sensor of ECF-type sigma factor [Aestuariibaculum sediminum]MBD0832317.1 sensor of ECF-type sigma factor [Aestuariibaculum sediminum]
MKNLILPILFLVSISVFAQSHGDKFKELKIPFISERINLTPTEAEKFWPIYNKYDNSISELRHKIRSIERKMKHESETISDSEAKVLLTTLNNYESELVDTRKKLNKELLNILSPKKVLKLQVAEEAFKRQLFDRYVKKKLEKKQ